VISVLDMRAPLKFAVLCGVLCATGCATNNPKSRYESEARSRLESLAATQSDAQFLSSMASLPNSVRERIGPVANAGAPFSIGCSGEAPHQRFLAATRSGGSYSVAIEQGGFAYFWHILQFDVDQAGAVVQERRLSFDPTCSWGGVNGTF